MKVLLINPPADNILRGNLPAIVEDETINLPPLGMLYVAAYAEELPEWEVRVIDCEAQEMNLEGAQRVVAEWQPDVVGIQAMTFTLIDCVMMAKRVKEAKPDCLLVMGGPHPTIYPSETVMIPSVDAVLIGEGEFSFQKLLQAFQAGEPIEKAGAITDPRQPVPPLEYIMDLDILKTPARHLLDLSRYRSVLTRSGRVTNMMSSRGCPGRCSFCDRPQMGKRFRKRSAKSVVDEMALCLDEYNIGEIIFYDDTFTIDRRRVMDICRLIQDRGLEVTWDIRARADTMTPEMITALKKAGCARIHYGVETGSPRLQKLIRKNLDLDKVREVFKRTKSEGIETLGYFMIGLPTEGADEIKQTMEYMSSLALDYVHVAVFTPFPGTDAYKEGLKSGFITSDYWREFSKEPRPDFRPPHWNEVFDDEELFDMLKRAYAGFYRRPGYIFNRILKVRSLDELLRKAKLGIKLLHHVS